MSSFEFISSSSSTNSKVVALKLYRLNKRDNYAKLTNEQLDQLIKGYRNEELNEQIYYIHKDKNLETKWFINEQEFHLMKLISKLEINIKETDEQLMISKSNLNKVNSNEVHALKINEIFWIRDGEQSHTLIENYLDEKLRKERNLEKKLSNLIENNVNSLVVLKDLMNSKLLSNFKETVIKIEENFNDLSN